MSAAPDTPAHETFVLAGRAVPRLFVGLWQLSSPAWGSAPRSRILADFARYVDAGFTAFDMADHYGDAELLFMTGAQPAAAAARSQQGRFRAAQPDPAAVFCATKYCVFDARRPQTAAVLRDAVAARLRNTHADAVDLLQYHWQHYDDPQYIPALRALQADARVAALGLCNFDSLRMQKVIDAGIAVATNQVQFSLIDSRPRYAMEPVCRAHNVKLLTYGTLCGGFLADKWRGKPAPDAFAEGMTPSLRKYLDMITIWGGWPLFQTLLTALAAIAAKHGVSVSTVAVRWVLDFPFVGAVIVGARMGVSHHIRDNLAAYGWSLDHDDRRHIELVLSQSRRDDVFRDMGDCGSEYR
ncbi:hypothetical protein LOZ64_000025 [Ophidiomyces ophidiicola]|nr:hypothetical protein LOZ64_000025 [Ophidiomyces ophidiicola]KAI2021773.1 hypothetical protein LOZ46_002192 [Ophidiomyces ophidiicola]KAI2039571.1 hypothetical protein LOZ47_002210 [Ophidiomyces ophidiicola]KAI2139864.1 hypothetical protein LOZ28_003077 [Ophidiomyces ophidiicola]KAI2144998.1 hypothetical protein LOZ29_000682 [Ophidiomyces ophidiicola]